METKNVQELLADTSRSLIEVYLDLQVLFEQKYGEDTVVVMEVGSFFEIYGVENEKNKIGKPKEVAEILNIQLTRKNKAIKENNVKNPLMAGFPSATFDRYIQRLIRENKYTIVIVRQKGVPPKVERYLDSILSPGINFDYSLNNDDNFVSSIILEKNKDIYSAGYASVDITTGKTFVFEIYSTGEDKTYALDQIFSLLKTHKTNEVVLTLAGETIDEHEIKHYLELHEDINVHINRKRPNIAYQNELFKKTYIVKSFLSLIEFLDLEKKPMASESFAILLEFIIEHDATVVKKMNKPEILNDKKFLYLGNNPLGQLNIVSRNSHDFTLLSLIDNTRTSIGRRLLKERLLNPIFDKAELEARYDLSDALREIYPEIDVELKNVYDLDRIQRRIEIDRLHPFEINFLYDSLTASSNIIEKISNLENENLLEDLREQVAVLEEARLYCEKTFCLDETAKYCQNDICKSFFNNGFNQELDSLLEEQAGLYEKLETIRTEIANLLESQTGKPEREYVILKQLEKEGHHISITKSRYFLIEKLMEKTFVSIDGQVYSLGDFKTKVQTGNVKISAEIIEEISEKISIVEKKITALVRELFKEQLKYIERKYIPLIKIVKDSLSRVDVALSNIKSSAVYNFTRPEILERVTENSYLELLELRHPLVEAREENGIYIPNDIVMGDKSYMDEASAKTTISNIIEKDVRGVLLYGINSSGKSSLMKSVGIAVVMAQSGFFVPAKRMRFTLFQEIFTRIIAQDNFEKGLSSFAVEMLEMKNIFNRATPKSLILGDEISQGTETLSALAIVGATIKRLSKAEALFISTTHLHQLHQLHVLDDVENIVSVHLNVSYDESEDKLIFDRNLKSGSGSSIYGLEFAQSLHMDKEFLNLAVKLRKDLAHENEEIQLVAREQTSVYNKNLFISSCAICGAECDDVHHIAQQKEANQDGNIKNFHKNHKYNLVPLCRSCHKKVHEEKVKIKGFKMTSDGLELEIE